MSLSFGSGMARYARRARAIHLARSCVGQAARLRVRIGSPRPVDLLEYQGKQLFAKHGVPVPEGRHATTVDEAVAAAEEVGYPCVVKAQVRIGGRGKAGGIKVAKTATRRASTPRRSSAWTSAGFTVHEVWVEQASDIDAEYYASIILDRSEKKLLAMLSRMGGMDVEEIAETDPDGARQAPHRAGEGLTAEVAAASSRSTRGIDEDVTDQVAELLVKLARRRARRGRDADRGQPADRHRRPPASSRSTPRSTIDSNASFRHDELAELADTLRRGPAGGDGEGEGPHLRQARRQHRHPRQRRRPLHVDARRRRPGRRQARELPRRRRRLEGRGDRRRARGDHLRRERQRDPLQHLRRDHPLRRDRQGDHRGLGADRDRRADGGPPRRHQLRGGPGPARRRRAPRTSTSRRRCSARPSGSWSWRTAA